MTTPAAMGGGRRRARGRDGKMGGGGGDDDDDEEETMMVPVPAYSSAVGIALIGSMMTTSSSSSSSCSGSCSGRRDVAGSGNCTIRCRFECVAEYFAMMIIASAATATPAANIDNDDRVASIIFSCS